MRPGVPGRSGPADGSRSRPCCARARAGPGAGIARPSRAATASPGGAGFLISREAAGVPAPARSGRRRRQPACARASRSARAADRADPRRVRRHRSDGVIVRANRAFLDLIQAARRDRCSAKPAALARAAGRRPAGAVGQRAPSRIGAAVPRPVHGELGTETEVEISAAGDAAGKAAVHRPAAARHEPQVARSGRHRSSARSGLMHGRSGSLAARAGATRRSAPSSGNTSRRRSTSPAATGRRRRNCSASAGRACTPSSTATARTSGGDHRNRDWSRGNAPGSRDITRRGACDWGLLPYSDAHSAFGQADLSNCEREQIHLAGSMQPHGALLVVREPDYVVVQASANAPPFSASNACSGRPSSELDGDLAARIRPHLGQAAGPHPDRGPLPGRPARARSTGCCTGRPPAAWSSSWSAPAADVDLAGQVETALQTILACVLACGRWATRPPRIFKDLTGYDRVMVYRFDEDGHGEIFAERREPRARALSRQPLPGLRHPADRAPPLRAQPRARAGRCRLRAGALAAAAVAAHRPAISTCRLCFLRSMSPIHIQYLKNMGVAATLVASLVVGGRLWGLVACHHYAPRCVHYEMRAAAELLAEAVATRIAALESFVQAQAELSVRRLEQRMMEAIAREGDWRSALFDSSQPAAAAAGRKRRGAAVRGPGPHRRRGPGHAAAARDRRLAGQQPRAPPDRHGLARASTSRPSRSLTPGRQRAAGHPGLEHARRVSDLVPAGAGPHRHLGRRSAQAGA